MSRAPRCSRLLPFSVEPRCVQATPSSSTAAACPPGWEGAIASQRPARGAHPSRYHRRWRTQPLSARERLRARQICRGRCGAPGPPSVGGGSETEQAADLAAGAVHRGASERSHAPGEQPARHSRTHAHILLARCFWLRRLDFLASRAVRASVDRVWHVLFSISQTVSPRSAIAFFSPELSPHAHFTRTTRQLVRVRGCRVPRGAHMSIKRN